MRLICSLALLFCSAIAWSADPAVKLNVKLGLWEVTMTTSMTGNMPFPPEALAQMTPEQRARFEASMKQQMSGAPRTTTEKSCETQEKLDQQLMFNDKKHECTRTIISSSATSVSMKLHCTYEGMSNDGTMRIDAITPESVKGNIDMDTSGSGQRMKMKATLTARWLGPNCGDVK